MQQSLNYIASEVHANYGPLFYPNSDEIKDSHRAKLALKFAYLENSVFATKDYMVGHSFTIADSYLWIVLSWSGYVGVDYSAFPKLTAFFQRVSALPGVVAAQAKMAESPKSIGASDYSSCYCNFS